MNAPSYLAELIPAHAPPDPEARLLAGAREVAAIAAAHADEVDRHAAFPHAALAALREHRLLGAMVPDEFGGDGASLDTVAAMCRLLGASCASTGMVFAMHQVQVACLVEHGVGSPWHECLLERLVSEQLLFASATSEEAFGGVPRGGIGAGGGSGGSAGSGASGASGGSGGCAVTLQGDSYRLSKVAPSIAYGEHADVILATARRHADAPPSDQVLICVPREDRRLHALDQWNTLGMRGTCSNGFRLEARGDREQILPVPFGEIADTTMSPVSHILWAALWTGIAGDAVQRAKAFFQGQVRARPDIMPISAARLAEAVATVQLMEARLDMALTHQRRRARAPSVAALFALAAEMNGLKTSVSTLALEAVRAALLICGMAGYRQDTPFSLGRHLRDLWSGPLMLDNDRILGNTASLLLAERSI